MPSKKVKLLNGEKISNDLIISSKDLFDIITNRINKVKKDTYRQEEIINLWKEKLSNLDDSKESSIKLSKWEFNISSGGYIRYLANKMNGCCFDIQRIRYYDL
jgi:predicted DNA-binding antitoxin AbrB/MazE fold protein